MSTRLTFFTFIKYNQERLCCDPITPLQSLVWKLRCLEILPTNAFSKRMFGGHQMQKGRFSRCLCACLVLHISEMINRLNEPSLLFSFLLCIPCFHGIYLFRPRGYEKFFMLNSVEHEILNAHKYKNLLKKSAF